MGREVYDGTIWRKGRGEFRQVNGKIWMVGGGGVEQNLVREFGRQENGGEERDQAVERWQISVIRNSA